MGYVIGVLTILFESVCIVSLILIMAAVFCGEDFKEIEIFPRKEGTWIKETRYYEAFPGSELKSESNLICVKCRCVYIPTPNCELSPTPKYCPECGRRMTNWKEITI